MTRKDLKILFSEYPDVVSLPEMCTMMGGIGDSTARKLLRSGRIKSFLIRSTYYIPKKCVIDYLLSDHYKMYRQELKHGIMVQKKSRHHRLKKRNHHRTKAQEWSGL